ncbi:MAG: hypothetical protein Q7K45_04510 [Nanoarchaeota archaeon]|nr:hypothetical protein [Nanoarchaeota archaeon]
MQNPLTSLDELIWKQFGKITNYANKTLGWTKYDCAYIAGTLENISLAGYGTYEVLLGFSKPALSGLSNILLGTGCAIFGGIHQKNAKKNYQIKEEQEIRQLAFSAAASQPHFNATRPSIIALGWLTGALGMEYLTREKTNYTTLVGLAGITASLMISFSYAKHYFEDQIMTPPSTKKPFWTTTYEGLKNKFHPKPQLEPAAEPAPQYISIDTLIT